MLKNAPEFEKENFDIFFVKINLPNQLDYVVDCLMVEPFIKEMREMRVSVYDNILHDYVEPRFRIKGKFCPKTALIRFIFRSRISVHYMRASSLSLLLQTRSCSRKRAFLV
jgi:hypothetical protein